MVEPESQLQGFSLQLGDGNRWWLAGLPPANAWLATVAPIMKLGQGKANGANLMVFFEGEALAEKLQGLVAADPGWRNADNNSLRFWFRTDSPDLLISSNTPFSELSYFTCIRYPLEFVYRQSIKQGGLPCHAALGEYQGQGVLLTAKSGTGKSTCYRRLPPTWQARCDDAALLVLGPDGRYLAHPFPTWSDYVLARAKKTYRSQVPSPLAGIFFLEQASQDACLPMKPSEAVLETLTAAQVMMARFLWCCGPEEARSIRTALFANAIDLFRKVPAFRLRVSLTGRFWEQIEAALDKH
ncbi:MAG: SynChlorMet cassette protein ScmC [Desulfobaccales bacterium]